jgi:hypothetical protein
MKSSYVEQQSVGLSGEAAYEELYSRLARWTGEAAHLYQSGEAANAEAKVDRCIALVGYMDRGIDIPIRVTLHLRSSASIVLQSAL